MTELNRQFNYKYYVSVYWHHISIETCINPIAYAWVWGINIHPHLLGLRR